MKRTAILAISLVFGAILILFASQGYSKTIFLEVNGELREIQSSAWTVAEFLKEQGYTLTAEDSVEPPLSSLLVTDQEIQILQAAWLTIQQGETINSIYTRQNSLEKILSKLEIKYNPDDQLYLDGRLAPIETRLSPGINHSLQIKKPEPVTLIIDKRSETFQTSSPTIGQALWSRDIKLEAGDWSSLPVDSLVDQPVEFELRKGKEITVQISDNRIRSKTTADIVGEALIESGIALQGLDYSRPGVKAPVPEEGAIQVIRVREEQFLESEPIPFDTETQPVADLEIDQRTIVQPGVLGLLSKRVRVRYEDGQEISRQVEDEYVSQPPQPEVLGYGTNIVPKTMDTPGGQITYWRALEMYAVSYNVTSNGGYGTATGIPLAKGVAAIDPRYIPYGTRMYVPGYGEALAADTGGGIKGRMIDLGYLDEDYVSWHQWVTVYFLWPPPDNVVWIIP